MKVRFVPRAQRDVDEIYQHNARHSAAHAQEVEAAIRLDAVEVLTRSPQIGVATGHRDTRRWWPAPALTMFYRVDWDADTIDVLRVIDGRRVKDVRRVPRD
jgi:plasmid stabilization system protein ParE